MSHPSELHAYVHARFRDAFGEPTHTVGKDEHWALRYEPGAVPIHVLVDGSVAQPAVWTVDTHNGDDGAVKTQLSSEAEVIAIINHIHQRLNQASLSTRGSGQAQTRRV